MQKRHIAIVVAAVALAVVLASVAFMSLNQAPSDDGSVTSTESENRGNDTGVAAPTASTETPDPE